MLAGLRPRCVLEKAPGHHCVVRLLTAVRAARTPAPSVFLYESRGVILTPLLTGPSELSLSPVLAQV